MKDRLLGKTRSALMLLVFVTMQTHFSAIAGPACPPPPPPPPGGQHPALLASYAKRPPWNVAGVDYGVGVPAMTTLTDWQLLSGPGITADTSATNGHVSVYNTGNVVISGVDFSLHGGAYLFFVNSPNPTVINSKFGGAALAGVLSNVISADYQSPGLTVSYNTIDGGGAGQGSSLVGAAGGGTTTLTYNWLKNFPQHVLEQNTQNVPYAVIYKNNLIEQGAMQSGAHLNYLQFDTNSNSSSSVDVEYNTSYQIKQASAGEGYQFYANGNGLVQNVTLAYNVMIAAAPGVGLPVPVSSLSISRMVHGGGSQNAGRAHDNYIDPTAAYGWLYYGSLAGWKYSNNYDMTTGAIEPGSP